MFPASTHSFFMVGQLWDMGVCTEPSLICPLSGACGLSSLRDEVQTLPGGFAQFRWVHTLPGRWAHSQIGGTWFLTLLY